MSPFNQQLDLNGGRHDLAPATESQKLFDSAPQIRGQIALETDWCDQATCPASECVECEPRPRIAERAKFHDARRWFEAGGTVLVSEYGHEPTRPVTNISTTHNRESIAWDDLVYYVREWRNRYPNQRFYIVREGGASS